MKNIERFVSKIHPFQREKERNYVKSNLHKIENLTLIDNGVRGCIERVRANRIIYPNMNNNK